MKPLSEEEINAVLNTPPPKSGRPFADNSHPLGFMRAVRDKLGQPPYDADALLELVKGEPGFYEVSRHPVLDPHALVEMVLRQYAGQVCKETYEVSYEDEDGHWLYDDPNTCDLDRLADHLRFRGQTDDARVENYKRLYDLAAERAKAIGKTVDQLLAEANSRYNERHELAYIEVVGT